MDRPTITTAKTSYNMEKEYTDNDLIPVRMGEKFGYINLNGEVVIPAQFDGGRLFINGLALVEINEKYGFINLLGDIVIPCKFHFVHDSFSRSGYCVVSIAEGRQGLIDRNGVFVIPPTYQYLHHFGNGVCRTENESGLRGLVSPNGVIVKFQFNDVYSSGNAYILRLDGKYGLANNNGIVVYPKYDKISGYLTDDIFEVCLDGKFGLIDINGKILAPVIYEEIFQPYTNQWARSYLNGHKVIFNKKGEQIWKE